MKNIIIIIIWFNRKRILNILNACESFQRKSLSSSVWNIKMELNTQNTNKTKQKTSKERKTRSDVARIKWNKTKQIGSTERILCFFR